MTRWTIVLLSLSIVLAALVVQLVPRYEIVVSGPGNTAILRIDRWAGRVEVTGYKGSVTERLTPTSWLRVLSTPTDEFLKALETVRQEQSPGVSGR